MDLVSELKKARRAYTVSRLFNIGYTVSSVAAWLATGVFFERFMQSDWSDKSALAYMAGAGVVAVIGTAAQFAGRVSGNRTALERGKLEAVKELSDVIDPEAAEMKKRFREMYLPCNFRREEADLDTWEGIYSASQAYLDMGQAWLERPPCRY